MQALAQSHCVVFAMMMAKLQFLKRRGSGGSKAHVSLNKGECVRKGSMSSDEQKSGKLR